MSGLSRYWSERLAATAVMVGVLLAGAGCAGGGGQTAMADLNAPQKLPLKKILPNVYRIPKTAFAGTYVYLKSLNEVKFQGPKHSDLATGMYLDNNHLIQFHLREHQLDIVAIDPLYQSSSDAPQNQLLASFPVRHVDIVENRDSRGLSLGDEIETESDRPWRERKYVVVDLAKDALDEYKDETTIAYALDTVEIVPVQGSINFDVIRQLDDQTSVHERYSFLKFESSATYQQREYPIDLQKRFGFFKTTSYRLDRYGRITQSGRKEFMDRWDLSKKIVYYFTKSCPDSLKPAARKVFANWNDVFKGIVGHDTLEVRENTGQELGDLRYNFVNCDASEYSGHSLLGYGPQVSNPRTGEIIKADVNIYLGTLNRSIYTERLLADLMGDDDNGGKAEASASISPPTAALDLASFRSIASLSSLVTPMGHATDVPTEEPDLRDAAQLIGRSYSVDKELASVRSQALKDNFRSITRVSPATLQTIKEAREKEKLSDDEIADLIFVPTLTHELGHNWGLRHNFKASADAVHVDEGSSSSSVMDYGFRSLKDPMKPGPYDRAALAVLYGPEAGEKNEIAQNFLFCTDEDILTSRDGLCNQFDSGTNLTQVVQNDMREYYASYPFTNLRLDRVRFTANVKGYISHLSQTLLPIRLAYDNAEGIIEAFATRKVDRLWYLAGQRIEADGAPDCEEGKPGCPFVTLTIPAGSQYDVKDGKVIQRLVNVKRIIDTRKFKPVIADAKNARRAATVALLSIILDEHRPAGDVTTQLTGELETRGVLPDKLVSLLMLTSPLKLAGQATVTSPFQSSRAIVGQLIVSLLSGTFPVPDAKGGVRVEPHAFPSGLREVALSLLKKQQGLPGVGESVAALVHIDKIEVDPQKLAELQHAEQAAVAKAAIDAELEKARGAVATHTVVAGVKSLALWFGLGVVRLPQEDTDARRLVATLEGASTKLTGADTKLSELLKAAPEDLRNIARIDTYRLAIQQTLAQQLLSRDGSAEAQRAFDNRVHDLEQARAEAVPVAYSEGPGESGGGHFLKATIDVRPLGLESASGLLLRDNVNRTEDQLAAIESLAKALGSADLKDAKQKAFNERLTATFAALVIPLRAKIASERHFGLKMSREVAAPDDGE